MSLICRERNRFKSTHWNNFCTHKIMPYSFSPNLIQWSRLWTHKVIKPVCRLVMIWSHLFHSWRKWEINDSSRSHGELPADLGARVCWFWTFIDDPISSHRVLSTLMWNESEYSRKIKYWPSCGRSWALRRQDVSGDKYGKTEMIMSCILPCLHPHSACPCPWGSQTHTHPVLSGFILQHWACSVNFSVYHLFLYPCHLPRQCLMLCNP